AARSGCIVWSGVPGSYPGVVSSTSVRSARESEYRRHGTQTLVRAIGTCKELERSSVTLRWLVHCGATGARSQEKLVAQGLFPVGMCGADCLAGSRDDACQNVETLGASFGVEFLPR